jgi:hypothetical protein
MLVLHNDCVDSLRVNGDNVENLSVEIFGFLDVKEYAKGDNALFFSGNEVFWRSSESEAKQLCLITGDGGMPKPEQVTFKVPKCEINDGVGNLRKYKYLFN